MFSQHLKIRKLIFRESDLFCVSGHLPKLFKIVKQQTPATILSHICTDCDKGVLFLTKMPTYFYFSSAQWLQRALPMMHSEATEGLQHLKSVNLEYITLVRWADGTNELSTMWLTFQVFLQKSFQLVFLLYNFTKIKIKSFVCLCALWEIIKNKVMLGTSYPWSVSHSSHRPSVPAYYIEDCRIFDVTSCLFTPADSLWFNYWIADFWSQMGLLHHGHYINCMIFWSRKVSGIKQQYTLYI